MGLKTVMMIADRVLGVTIAEAKDGPGKNVPLAESETAMMSFAFGTCVAFVILGATALTSDFSAEEIGLTHLFMGDTFPNLLLNAGKAGCHPLYHGLLWFWVHVFGGTTEAFLRLPNLLFILLTAYVAYVSGKRLFRSPGMAWALMTLIVLSPTFINNYAWAFGYSLTIFLACLATAGALFAVSGERLKGIFMLAPAMAALPLVIPATFTVNVTIILFLSVFYALRRKFMMNFLYICLVTVLGLVGVGFNAYLSTMGTGRSEMLPAGRGYGGNVGMWLLAVVAQIGLFVAIAIVARRQKDLPPSEPDERSEDAIAMKRYLPALAICGTIVGTVCLGTFDVDPLDCMALLVPISFGAIGWYDHRINRVNKYFFIMLLVLFGNHLLVTRVANHLMTKDIGHGRYAKNLLQRYDCVDKSMSRAVRTMVKAGVPERARVFVQPELFDTFAYYWQTMGRDVEQLERLEETMELALESEHYRYFSTFAIGHSDVLIQKRLQRAFGTIQLQRMSGPKDVLILRVLMPPPPGLSTPEPDPKPATPIALKRKSA